MAKYVFGKIVAPAKLQEMLEKELGSAYRIVVKRKRVKIVQGAARGRVIQTKDKDGKTVCSGPYGIMPSGRLRAVLILGFFALLFVIGLSMGYLVVGIGFLAAIILILLMKAPSRKLVSKVSGVTERLVTNQWSHQNA